MNPFSARTVLSRAQRAGLIVALVLIAVWAVLRPMAVLQTVVAVVTVAYGAAIVFRVVLVWAASRGEHLIRVTDEEARAIPDADLPVYTVLVPAYREPSVIGLLMSHLGALEYPKDRLEVILLLEEDDRETIEAASAVATEPHVRILVVPESQPKTKPKACNVGLEQATGEFVTIYDAEDIPDPLQLRRAVVALRRLGAEYVCLQAELGYFNVDQNRITRWFALEYATWFRSLLPGLVALRMPIPLGGTSNHFRARELRELGAWDPYNVTEDADLGIRLARSGLRVGVLHSITLEEANSDFINWIKQRSRWYKGYLMTWLVHLRAPRATIRQLGWRGLLCLNLFVGGTPLAALLNAVLWATTILWFLDRPPVMEEIFVPPFYYLGVLCLVFGNATVIYLNVLSARTMDRPDLLGTALLSPVYWAMMSLAGAKAAWQLIVKPSYWEKTTHGLHLPSSSKEAADVS
ncbi:N-acetylglucosaminyltransferase [Actinoplanes lobatus]|uniref:Cellulose synthase/poly-beta-1,6-N-acetylglucosamine synthase-like glycosyltransferase n=1 Tax=Actinoplanes lobatus TaxID=113568 RepID=A0A7W7HFQ2_9ACTN|nr:glycosyltransferase [Actinoplanes lobatus]MBB4749694.1 cellulose synthase/poly-beta-1,6-N-acetylglucosamine synthase-like glycosyltransferase [Actinoplanes lobatus]GGN75801.1 N-acetylglucosaminyltransferase [Actinoplanes lobatus]GIE38432.1 N-acetylglucosaminyltransferase [Actinoplanes lobatus]